MMQRTISAFVVFSGCCFATIFPAPRELASSASNFVLDDRVAIAIPARASAEDLFLARFLSDEFSDRWGVHLRIESVNTLDPRRRAIAIADPEADIAPARRATSFG
jgi:hypothetical protein